MPTAFTQAPSNDFSSVYKPANAVEQMMVDQIGMMWQRLQFAASAEQRYFATRDILEVLAKKPQEYKAITRLVSDCERAWRHAIVHLERMQRQRLHPRPAKPAASPNPKPAPQPATQNSDLCVSGARNIPEAKPIATRAG